jgi:hypothetical protein
VAVLKSRPKTEAALETGGGSGTPTPAATGGAPLSAKAPESATQPTGGPFPIENYDDLEVVEVLPLLGDLTTGDLDQVRQREAAGRAHPWILARIDALLESEAETGEWAPSGYSAGVASFEDRGHEADEEDEGHDEALAQDDHQAWAPPESEWGGSTEVADWSASDFELESAEDTLFEDIDAVAPARSGGLPIPNYDDLRANEVLPLLSNLSPRDLQAVRAAEAAGKNRTSILSRIDTLLNRAGVAGAESAPRPKTAGPAKATSRAAQNLPIGNYDSLTVAQSTAVLPTLSAAELRTTRTYERRHKARQGVLMKIEGALARSTR